MNRPLRVVTLVLATLAGVLLLWQFRDVVVLFLLALSLSAALGRPIAYLVRKGVPRLAAIILVYGAVLALAGALIYGVGNSLIVEAQVAGNGYAEAVRYIRTTWGAESPWQQFIANQVPDPADILAVLQSGQSLQLAQAGLGFTLGFLGILTQVMLMLVLSVYWSIDRDRFAHLWLGLLDGERRHQARAIWEGIGDGVGAYLRRTVGRLIVAGLLLELGYRLLGIGAPVTLALVAALIWLIPLLGWALAAIPAGLVGLIVGPHAALEAAVYTLAVLIVAGFVAEVRRRERRRYNAMLTILVMIGMYDVLGIVGLLIAVPLAAAIQIVLSEVLAPYVAAAATVSPADRFARFQQRVAAVQAAAQRPLSPEQAGLVGRLMDLAERAGREYGGG